MDRTPTRPAPPLIDVLEAARGLSFDAVELEELILAVDDRLEYGAAAESRVVLRRIRHDLNLELGRLVAAV